MDKYCTNHETNLIVKSMLSVHDCIYDYYKVMSYTWQLACYLLDGHVLLWHAMEPVHVLQIISVLLVMDRQFVNSISLLSLIGTMFFAAIICSSFC